MIHNDSVALVGQSYLIDYVKHLGQKLQSIRATVVNCQPPPPDKPFHNVKPGDWVYVKSLSGDPLQEKWEGPYQTLLTTHTAIKVQGKPTWIHYTRTKPAPKPEWEARRTGLLRLQLRKINTT